MNHGDDSKHIFWLQRNQNQIDYGTQDEKKKGGFNHFDLKSLGFLFIFANTENPEKEGERMEE
jgi:hypothetical protein